MKPFPVNTSFDLTGEHTCVNNKAENPLPLHIPEGDVCQRPTINVHVSVSSKDARDTKDVEKAEGSARDTLHEGPQPPFGSEERHCQVDSLVFKGSIRIEDRAPKASTFQVSSDSMVIEN